MRCAGLSAPVIEDHGRIVSFEFFSQYCGVFPGINICASINLLGFTTNANIVAEQSVFTVPGARYIFA